jgi:hypothetical protein
MFKRLFSSLPTRNNPTFTAPQYHAILRQAGIMGGRLFGPIPSGHRREFFCLDETTWVWYEAWYDIDKKMQTRTVHYRIRPETVIKSVNGAQYQSVSLNEAERLLYAAERYEQNLNQLIMSAQA